MIPRWFPVTLAFIASLFLLASQVKAASLNPQHPVAFTAHLIPADPHAGEYAAVEIDATIAPGWHLYSLTPTSPPGPTSTSITLATPPSNLAAAGVVSEDAPVMEVDPNFANLVSFHQTRARFLVPIRIGGAAPSQPGETLPVQVHYQTCNSTICLPPTTVTISVAVAVAAGPARAQYAALPHPLANLAPTVTAAATATAAASRPSIQGSLWRFALAAFGGGLLALLTPCVFPLIPVTFGFFTKQVADNRRKLIGLAGAYALGIIISFVALGLIAAVLFGAAGANKVAANPWFNLFFGILFVAFAFSFFESFIVTLPQGISRFARPAAGSSGLGGVLLMGLAFVFAAFTCTAPFIGTVLVAAASATGAREWLRPLLGMGCFALALALPFFLLALFPSLLAKLPRSGGWMTRFKAVLGFVELAYALTYFSKADLVWQAHILTQPVIYALWALICFSGMLYLLGLLRVSAYPDEAGRISPASMIFAALFGVLGLCCLYPLTGRHANLIVAAFLPPSGYGPSLYVSVTSAANAANDISSDSSWLTSYPAALAQAKSSGKPVFIDFTGYTCTNCRYVEQNTFTVSSVKDLLTNQVTRLRLYTDGGASGPANEALQQKLFGTVALPLYAVVSPDGKVLSQNVGSSASPTQFAAFIQKGIQLAQAQLPDAGAPGNQVAQANLPQAPSAAGAAATWTAFTPTALAQAGTTGKPAVVDFTASWCTNCHALERTVFTAPPVASQLAQFSTFSANFDLPTNAASEKKYNIYALPAVLFFDKHGNEVPGTRVTGLISAADFAARLKKAAA